MPAAIFADILPNLGSSVPVMRSEANRWGTLIRLDRPDCHFGFPFRRVASDFEDACLTNAIQGSMDLPDSAPVRARRSESYAYATHDPRLRATLKMDQDAFAYAYCLHRGVLGRRVAGQQDGFPGESGRWRYTSRPLPMPLSLGGLGCWG
jgi:hypothetical protein